MILSITYAWTQPGPCQIATNKALVGPMAVNDYKDPPVLQKGFYKPFLRLWKEFLRYFTV